MNLSDCFETCGLLGVSCIVMLAYDEPQVLNSYHFFTRVIEKKCAFTPIDVGENVGYYQGVSLN